uniref:Uncharacterized protein n=1 Tax=Rhizophora mucronata TaxID=61149 RepID=A0A2P2PIK2_RHIMU
MMSLSIKQKTERMMICQAQGGIHNRHAVNEGRSFDNAHAKMSQVLMYSRGIERCSSAII